MVGAVLNSNCFSLLFKMVGKLRICKTVAKSIGFSNQIKVVGKTRFSSSEQIITGP